MAAHMPDDVDQVARLACFGSDDGSHHVLHRAQPPNHAEFVKIVLRDRSKDVVKRLKTIANRKSYSKKENLLFSLAATINAFGVDDREHSTDSLSEQAYKLVERLCEKPSDLFNFIHFDKEIRSSQVKASWGRGMRALVTNFYSKRSPDILAREITQCKSGRGFSHRDLMRLTHMPCDKNASKGASLVLNYALKGDKALEQMETGEEEEDDEVFAKVRSVLKSVEQLRKTQDSEKEIIRGLIEANKLVDKQIPSHFFKMKEVFEGMLGHMSLYSLVKNIPKMAELGILDSLNSDSEKVIDRLKDGNAHEEERVSPVTVFAAQRRYDMNRFKKWIRNTQLSQAMKVAFELSLANMPTTNKRYLLACHIDDKTLSKQCVTGTACMSPIIPCVILAQMLARRESNPDFVYFKRNTTEELRLTKNITSVAVIEQILNQAKGPTNEDYDACEPLKWAAEKRKPYDCILIVMGKKRVSSHDELKAAINRYRAESGVLDAKVVVIGLAGPMSFPDKEDINFLDVTGFDEEVLDLLHAFCKGFPIGNDDDNEDNVGGDGGEEPVA